MEYLVITRRSSIYKSPFSGKLLIKMWIIVGKSSHLLKLSQLKEDTYKML
jgi:hypothetical protein